MRVIITSSPDLAFYDDDNPPDIDLRWRRLVAVGETRSMLRVSGGETPNGSVEIDNGDGAITSHMTGALLRQPVKIYDGSALIFSGVISRITVGNTIKLDAEA